MGAAELAPEIAGELEAAGWLEVGSGQPIPRPSNPLQDEVEAAELVVTGGLEAAG